MVPEFTLKTKEKLAKIAGSHCCNPDCRKLTSGGSLTENVIVIGEAAHIFGARVGSARYKIDMSDVTRADVSNGIWLCSNCHKIVDDDPTNYPAGLLFKWVEMHAAYTSKLLQSGGAIARAEYRKDLFERYDNLSSSARRIIVEKPDFWEGLLTLELLREHFAAGFRAMADIQAGILFDPAFEIVEGQEIHFVRRKLNELERFVEAATLVVTEQLIASWGEAGQPGDVDEIVYVCSSMGKLVNSLVGWERELGVVFLQDEKYREIVSVFRGCTEHIIEELKTLLGVFEGIVEQVLNAPEGEMIDIDHTMVICLPEGFSSKFNAALSAISYK